MRPNRFSSVAIMSIALVAACSSALAMPLCPEVAGKPKADSQLSAPSIHARREAWQNALRALESDAPRLDNLLRASDSPLSNSLSKAEKDSLLALPKHVRGQLFLDYEALSPPGSASLSTSRVAEVKKAWDLRAFAFGLPDTVGQDITLGYLGKSPEKVSVQDLLKREKSLSELRRIRVRDSVAQPVSLDSIVRERLRQDETQQIRLPGRPLPGGLLPIGGGFGGPLVIDAKRSCLRNATPQDNKFVGNDKRLPFVFDPWGFPYVGFLAFPTVTSAGELRVSGCTFFMVSPTTALTAAHCLFVDADQSKPRNMASESVRVFLPKKVKDLEFRRSCYASPVGSDCPYHRGRVVSAKPIRSLSWNAQGPHPDIAVLKVDLNGYSPERFAKVDVGGPTVEAVTMVGYGATLTEKLQVGTSLEVTWQEQVQESPAFFKWPQRDWSALPEPGVCRGDSGGPILVAKQYGAGDESHRVVGVVSFLKTPTKDTSSTHCPGGTGFAVSFKAVSGPLCESLPAGSGC